jgi:hypothetical protein
MSTILLVTCTDDTHGSRGGQRSRLRPNGGAEQQHNANPRNAQQRAQKQRRASSEAAAAEAQQQPHLSSQQTPRRPAPGRSTSAVPLKKQNSNKEVDYKFKEAIVWFLLYYTFLFNYCF